MVVIFVFVLAVSVWSVWATVVAFMGGTIPLTGVQSSGGVGFGLFWLFVVDPAIATIIYWLANGATAILQVARTQTRTVLPHANTESGHSNGLSDLPHDADVVHDSSDFDLDELKGSLDKLKGSIDSLLYAHAQRDQMICEEYGSIEEYVAFWMRGILLATALGGMNDDLVRARDAVVRDLFWHYGDDDADLASLSRVCQAKIDELPKEVGLRVEIEGDLESIPPHLLTPEEQFFLWVRKLGLETA